MLPDEQGWTGLAYCYNMYTGWYERQMEIGEVQAVQWPMPNGNIYPAQH